MPRDTKKKKKKKHTETHKRNICFVCGKSIGHDEAQYKSILNVLTCPQIQTKNMFALHAETLSNNSIFYFISSK